MVSVIDFLDILISQKDALYEFGVEVSANTSNPKAFDCSELIEWACRRLNVNPIMPDGSWKQATHCKKYDLIISVERAIITPGALLFKFSSNPYQEEYPEDAKGHVAASIGNGMTFEAHGSKKGVGCFSVEDRGWTHAGLIPGIRYSIM